MDNTTKKRWTLASAGAAAGLTIGLVLGGLGIASAQSSPTSTTTPSSSSSSSATSGSQPDMPAHGTPAHEDAEKAVTGTAATQAQAAAVKSVGSGTAGAVTTDFSGTGYEVTVTKADGSTVEVHMDSSFTVMQGGGGHPGPSTGGTAG